MIYVYLIFKDDYEILIDKFVLKSDKPAKPKRGIVVDGHAYRDYG